MYPWPRPCRIDQESPQRLPIGIKWPNDIYAHGRIKIGGVLCQSSFSDGRFDICVGVGINVTNRSPTTCLVDLNRAPGLSDDDAPPPLRVTREDVLAAFLNTFEPRLAELIEHGFEGSMSDAYHAAWIHSGQRVTVSTCAQRAGSPPTEPATKVDAVIDRIGPDGYLVARSVADGERLVLMPDGNTFDMMQSLIVRKRA